jgi:putative acetyltransferase
VAALFRRVRREALPYLPDLHDGDEDRAFFSRAIRESEVWLAQSEGDLVAFAAWRPGWLDHLYVAPEGRGQGIGRLLVEMARRGQTTLRLWVFQKNAPAIAFYERLSFRPERLTDGARNEEGEPDALYLWQDGQPDA